MDADFRLYELVDAAVRKQRRRRAWGFEDPSDLPPREAPSGVEQTMGQET
ncbi:hypothetical protein AB0O28_18680 [Microbispora sp. NPDC088329]